MRLSPILSIGLALGLIAPASSAQAPKTGSSYYEDEIDLGFKFKEPKGWDFIPPQPGDPNLIGLYAAPNKKGILFPKEGKYWGFNAWVVKFDRREEESKVEAKKGAKVRILRGGAKDIEEWVQRNINASLSGANFQADKDSAKDLSINGCEASEIVFNGESGGVDLALYAAVFKLRDDVEVALVFNGPGANKWSKYERAFRKFAKTFSTIEIASPETAELGGGSLRETKRAKLKASTSTMPGWELYETENYFVVSNNDDQDFLEELMIRLEAIRVVYEETYPPSLAEELNLLAAAKRAKEDDGKPKRPGRAAASEADPMERSRTSVVRVCANEDQYHSYGGPSSSAGYWSSSDEELVIYDDQASGGRRNTWATLNHEAFHQYCFYFFGNLAPHPWYNEGTGDFYSGYQLKNRKFQLKPFDWRVSTVKELIRENQFVPLEELVRFDQGEYYGSNKYGTKGGENYATGWAVIYFLRTGSNDAKNWNPAWDTILDTYLRVLVETDDLDAAVDQAFAGVDWEEFENSWKDYIKRGL
jgi:hypothetical protein